MFLVQFTTGATRSVSYLQNFKLDSLNEAIEIFTLSWDFKDEAYRHVAISKLMIKCKFYSTDELVNKIIRRKELPKKVVPQIEHSGVNIPITMDISKWGSVIKKNKSAARARGIL